VRPLSGGVTFGGPLWSAYRALLWSRVASRILLTLERVPAATSEELYDAVAAIPWEDHLGPDGTLAIDASGVNAGLRNTQFTAVRVKDAIADRFIQKFGRRPSVNTSSPDVRVNVVVRNDRATISIDLSGQPLHRRGYREQGTQVEAPMKETLAAAVLLIAGWPAIAAQGGCFVDPLCGSGTLPIEAAMIAGDVAPGLMRTKWGFSRWLGHDHEAWAAVLGDAVSRREAGLKNVTAIRGSDADGHAVDIARECVARAGLEGVVEISRRDLAELVADDLDTARPQPGLVAINPPYGERIQAQGGLGVLYRELSERLRAGFPGWTLAVITPDAGLSAGVALTADKTAPLYNGRILTQVSVFRVAGADEPAPEGAPCYPSPAALSDAALAFGNRLRKNLRHLEKWARRSDVTCFRVYDADLPDYAVAVDLYTGAGTDSGARWAHVAEYAPPPGIDIGRAQQRLDDVLAVVPEILGIEPEDVFLKVRQRQRGDSQYERVSRSGVVGTVSEGGLLFEVNLTDYLDTGIFLDHRMTREWIRDLAADKRFLNLFAYTGTVSVYAADGGARETTTVDLSATYVGWSERNMARNGFSGAQHRRVQADVLQWIDAAAATPDSRYDLVFCDPPTFSNSKRMQETWDVQRDHVALLTRTAEVLAPGGVLFFSCNRRKFSLDLEALTLAGLECENVTARTIPKDFERKPGVHSCWLIRRSEA
jgi:23S rRNA (guanine2445-N2)-methyltransferase / 23S rRNA (guanine2069-N7)-methyltransferase